MVMRATGCPVCLLLLAMILTGPAVLPSEAASDPVSQAWAVRIDGPTNTPIQAAGIAVGPSGDVFLASNVRGGGYYIRDILISRRSSSGALVWERRYEPPEGASANESPFGIVAHG